MTLGLAYWILMLLALFLLNWPDHQLGQPFPVRPLGGSLLLFFLLLILGWHVFGAPVHG